METDSYYGVNFSHPTFMAEMFAVDAPYNLGPTTAKYTVEGLAKMFFFESYLKAKAASAVNTSRNDVLKEELDRYPYAQKSNLQTPYSSPFDSLKNDDFFHSLTDCGVCQVYNGNSFKDTFKEDDSRDQ